MSFLDTLEGITLDPTVKVKDKLIQDIELQKQAADAESKGQPFNPRNSERAFPKWFFRLDGAWWSHLKAGNAMLLIKGRNSFKAGTNLTDWYDEVIGTVRSGALDAEIEAAVKGRKKQNSKRQGKLEVVA